MIINKNLKGWLPGCQKETRWTDNRTAWIIIIDYNLTDSHTASIIDYRYRLCDIKKDKRKEGRQKENGKIEGKQICFEDGMWKFGR